MSTVTQKTDRIYEEMLQMENRFAKLEKEQQEHFTNSIEKASATILAEIKKLTLRIENCECNKEILDYLQAQDKQRKAKEPTIESDSKKTDTKPGKNPVKYKPSQGWHPENLKGLMPFKNKDD